MTAPADRPLPGGARPWSDVHGEHVAEFEAAVAEAVSTTAAQQDAAGQWLIGGLPAPGPE